MELFASSFRQSESQVLKTIAERMVFVPTSKEGIGQALNEFSVHMRERLFMEVIIEDYYTNRDGSTNLYVTQESLLADFSAFVLIRDAPFKNKIDKCMMAFHTGGLIDKWKDMVMDVVRREGRQRRRLLGNVDDEDSANVKIKPLSMVHMQGPFLLYVLCAIVSTAAFLGEVTQGPFLRKKRYGSE
ncbi:uncharacterized protein LOC135108644 [Scylla paramamosain]|uniref:uncharacterized protein LOC135108644 n=1 Tax=Scylla paramamosain TaxID=85552 RepID=UPI003083553D